MPGQGKKRRNRLKRIGRQSVVPTPEEAKEFKIWYPQYHLPKYRDDCLQKCKGCDRMFPCKYNRYQLEYFDHCLEECEGYQKTGLIRYCFKCKLKFVNMVALTSHISAVHKDEIEFLYDVGFKMMAGEDNEADEVKISGKTEEHVANATELCRGCLKEFPAYIGCLDSIGYSVDFYEHCFVRCQAYKDTNLIVKCDQCEYSYINDTALKHHKEQDHRKPIEYLFAVKETDASSDEENEEDCTNVDEAMPKSVAFRCDGCSKMFRKKDKNAEKNYMQHCFDCDEFKQLGVIISCSFCPQKFIRKKTLRAHVKAEHAQGKPLVKFVVEAEIVCYGDKKLEKVVPLIEETLINNATGRCPGCAVKFPAHMTNTSKKHYTQEYYEHILDCDMYLESGKKIFTCEFCDASFFMMPWLTRHRRQRHPAADSDSEPEPAKPPKPDWMSESTYLASTENKIRKLKVKCKGCKKKFKTYTKKDDSFPEFSFYVHCIEKCKKYKDLNLIVGCDKCGLKYLESYMLDEHNRFSHKRGRPSRNCAARTSHPPSYHDAIFRAYDISEVDGGKDKNAEPCAMDCSGDLLTEPVASGLIAAHIPLNLNNQEPSVSKLNTDYIQLNLNNQEPSVSELNTDHIQLNLNNQEPTESGLTDQIPLGLNSQELSRSTLTTENVSLSLNNHEALVEQLGGEVNEANIGVGLLDISLDINTIALNQSCPTPAKQPRTE